MEVAGSELKQEINPAPFPLDKLCKTVAGFLLQVGIGERPDRLLLRLGDLDVIERGPTSLNIADIAHSKLD